MKRVLKIAVPLVVWLAVWQIAAVGVGQAYILPSPAAVMGALSTLVGTALFWQSAGMTLLRVFGGFLLGTLLGAALGAGRFAAPWCDWLFSPLVKIIRAVPVVCFILWVLLWRPTDQVPLVVSALMVIPVVWGNTRQGLSSTDPLLLELAQAYRFGRWKTAWLVYGPSALPAFASGCETALGLAWKAGVAAEVLCLPRLAVGSQVAFSRNYLDTPDLLAWTVLIVALSWLTERLAHIPLRRLGRVKR